MTTTCFLANTRDIVAYSKPSIAPISSISNIQGQQRETSPRRRAFNESKRNQIKISPSRSHSHSHYKADAIVNQTPITMANTTTSKKKTASSSSSFTIHSSVSEIVDQYDGFILDQFGVLHNGTVDLPGAADCVRELNQRGKKLIILSNSSSLASNTRDRLGKFKLNPEHFVGAVTSGEEAALHIRENYAAKRGLFFTWATPKTPSPTLFVKHCGDFAVTDKVDDADIILLHGCQVLRGPGADGEAAETSLGDFMNGGDTASVIKPTLERCLERKLPMVCANPDFKMVNPDGSTSHMPGEIAKLYEEMGGKVISFGKPYKEHFDACIRDLGLPKDKVVHVGDSLHHDIAGANDTGIASIFVVGGVHRDEVGCELGSVPTRESLDGLFDKHKQTPTHVVPVLKF